MDVPELLFPSPMSWEARAVQHFETLPGDINERIAFVRRQLQPKNLNARSSWYALGAIAYLIDMLHALTIREDAQRDVIEAYESACAGYRDEIAGLQSALAEAEELVLELEDRIEDLS